MERLVNSWENVVAYKAFVCHLCHMVIGDSDNISNHMRENHPEVRVIEIYNGTAYDTNKKKLMEG